MGLEEEFNERRYEGVVIGKNRASFFGQDIPLTTGQREIMAYAIDMIQSENGGFSIADATEHLGCAKNSFTSRMSVLRKELSHYTIATGITADFLFPSLYKPGTISLNNPTYRFFAELAYGINNDLDLTPILEKANQLSSSPENIQYHLDNKTKAAHQDRKNDYGLQNAPTVRRYGAVGINLDTETLSIHGGEVSVSVNTAMILHYLIAIAEDTDHIGRVSYADMAERLPFKASSMKVQISIARKELSAIKIAPNVTGNALILGETGTREMSGTNEPKPYRFNTELANALYEFFDLRLIDQTHYAKISQWTPYDPS